MGGALVALLMLLGLALASAASTWRAPFPQLFVDPFGAFSNVSWLSWDSDALGLRFPERLVQVGDEMLARAPGPGTGPSALERMARIQAAGATEVTLTFAGTGTPRTVRRPLGRLGAEEIGFFFGLYALAGAFLMWTGVVVLRLAGRREGARAYAAWSAHAGVMLLTFYDYHTRAWLWPFFSTAGVGFAVFFFWLAYAFPEPPRRGRRVLRALLVALTVVGGAVALWLLVAPLLGRDTSAWRMVVSQGLIVGMAVLLLTILVRVRGSGGQSRAELVSAAWGLAMVPGALALGFLAILVMGRSAVHLWLPFAFPLIPVSIGFALVRHNILGTDAVLNRSLLGIPILLGSCGAGVLAWLFFRAVVRADASPWLAVLLSVPVALATGGLIHRVTSRLFFPGATQDRAVLDALSDHLATQREPEAIQRAIEAAVMRWLPTESARVIPLEEVQGVARVPQNAVARLADGESVWTEDTPWQRSLLVALRSLGEVRGVLLLAPKRRSAPYTSADLTLLSTIASLGAVALHNAAVLTELEALRRREVEVTRDEKRFALGMFGAEISHEVTYSLNFFRYLLKRSGTGHPLDTKDVEIGREEVARLERMLAALRKLKTPSPTLRRVPISEPIVRALELLRELLEEKQIHVAMEIPPDVVLSVDPDLALQLFANLLRNAAQAVGQGGSIGARLVRDVGGERIEVWDDGPGIPEALSGSIWSPWTTTKPGGTGLGLVISQRLARAFGWTLSLERRTGQTCFCLALPAATRGSAAVLRPPTSRTAHSGE